MKHLLSRRLFVSSAVFLLLFAAVVSANTKKPPLRPININTATSEQLQLVPGIGPTTAEKILTMRKSYGPFKSVDDLLAIKGLGKKRLDKMRKYLTVGKAAAANRPQVPVPNEKSAPAASQKSAQAKPDALPENSTPTEQSDSPKSEEPPR
jgi:competence ComEA-like helix-hairpin-helix protein